MINISKLVQGWSESEGWFLAPAGFAWIEEGASLKIGNEVEISEGCYLRTYVDLGNLAKVGCHTTIGEWSKIGRDTTIGNNNIIGANVIIGRFTKIGNGVSIGLCSQIGKHVEIGNNVKIGNYARLRDNSTVKDGCILGNSTRVGTFAVVGNRVTVGDYQDVSAASIIGDDTECFFNIGFADGYMKTLCMVNGIAYISAGCRWMTLADAIVHWGEKPNREVTSCLLKSAIAIAELRGWELSE